MKKALKISTTVILSLTAVLNSACSSANNTPTDLLTSLSEEKTLVFKPAETVYETTETVTVNITAYTSKTDITTVITEPEAAPLPQTEPINTKTEPPASTVQDEAWAMYIIGNNNPLPENYLPQTKYIADDRALDVRCADYAIQMLSDATAQGIGLYVTSAYRSIETQRINLQNKINSLIDSGYSKEEAIAKAQTIIAIPGRSEHNAALAMDIVSSDYWINHTVLEQSFDKLPQFDWLIENSWKYGFILSYPKGKENITGFIYEPWHYRFVGLNHAKKIYERYKATGEFLTVNEYLEIYN